MKRIYELFEGKEVGDHVEVTAEVKEILDDIAVKEEERKAKEEEKRAEKRKENDPLKELMLGALKAEPDRIFVAKELAEVANISTQKATPLLREMAEDGYLIREQEKKSKPFTYKLNKEKRDFNVPLSLVALDL